MRDDANGYSHVFGCNGCIGGRAGETGRARHLQIGLKPVGVSNRVGGFEDDERLREANERNSVFERVQQHGDRHLNSKK